MDISQGIDAVQIMSQATTSLRPVRGGTVQDQAKLKELAQEFEAIFIQQMYKEMRSTIPDDGLIPRTNAEDMFAQMQDLEVARETAHKGGIGLAEIMLKQLQEIE